MNKPVLGVAAGGTEAAVDGKVYADLHPYGG